MAWTGGITRTTGTIIVASHWNQHLGAGGDLDTLFDGISIESELVRESSMLIGNAPTDGLFLQAQSAQTGGLLWSSVDTSLFAYFLQG